MHSKSAPHFIPRVFLLLCSLTLSHFADTGGHQTSTPGLLPLQLASILGISPPSPDEAFLTDHARLRRALVKMANSKRLKVHHEEDGPVLHYHFHGPIDTLITVTKSTGVTVSLPAFNNKDPSIGVDGFLDPVDITQKGHSQDDEDADGRHNIDLLLSKARPSLRPDEETTEDPQRTTAAPEAFMNVQQEQEESQTGWNIVAEATDGENKSPNVIALPAYPTTHSDLKAAARQSDYLHNPSRRKYPSHSIGGRASNHRAWNR